MTTEKAGEAAARRVLIRPINTESGARMPGVLVTSFRASVGSEVVQLGFFQSPMDVEALPDLQAIVADELAKSTGTDTLIVHYPMDPVAKIVLTPGALVALQRLLTRIVAENPDTFAQAARLEAEQGTDS